MKLKGTCDWKDKRAGFRDSRREGGGVMEQSFCFSFSSV